MEEQQKEELRCQRNLGETKELLYSCQAIGRGKDEKIRGLESMNQELSEELLAARNIIQQKEDIISRYFNITKDGGGKTKRRKTKKRKTKKTKKRRRTKRR